MFKPFFDSYLVEGAPVINLYTCVCSESSPNVPNPRYGQALATQAPRHVRFSVTCDY